MMREEPKHLKRGLKDISPLFQQTAPVKEQVFTPRTASVSSQLPTQSLSVICPESPSNSLFFNASLASKMQAQAYDCALISVADKSSKKKPLAQSEYMPVKRFMLSQEQFEEICHSKNRSAENFGSSVFFFDFDYGNPILLEKVMPILDKWVLLIKPGEESMMEGYKYIKASLPLNSNLEYFMVINGMPSDTASSRFFERFSEMVSRRLGVNLHWLGHFDPRFPQAVDGLVLDNLQLASSADSIEKRAFAGFIYPASRS